MDIEEQKEKIVKTATELFKREGCKRVTMDTIATELHISKRTLYEYFENKEELLTECHRYLIGMLNQSHRELFTQVDEPMLLILAMFHNRVQHSHEYDTFIADTKRYYPQIFEHFDQEHSLKFNQVIINALKEAQAKGVIRDNVDIETVVSWTNSFISMIKKPLDNSTEKWIRSADKIAFAFTRGLMTTSAIERYDAEEKQLYEILSKYCSSDGTK